MSCGAHLEQFLGIRNQPPIFSAAVEDPFAKALAKRQVPSAFWGPDQLLIQPILFDLVEQRPVADLQVLGGPSPVAAGLFQGSSD